MFQLKPIHKDAIPEALRKVERYRLLNEPAQAESICQDVLSIDPDNQEALVMLLLALTDQFDHGRPLREARAVIPRLRGEYEQAYYNGIISERWARTLYHQGSPGAGFNAYDWFVQAMGWYEKAEALRPAGNDDAILRWNTCARFVMRHPHLEPRPEERPEPLLSE